MRQHLMVFSSKTMSMSLLVLHTSQPFLGVELREGLNCNSFTMLSFTPFLYLGSGEKGY